MQSFDPIHKGRGKKLQQPTLDSSRVRRWLGHLWREWTVESWRPIAPTFAKPEPAKWNDAQVTIAWIGHATVLIDFFGIRILTDPVLFSRIGIRLPGITVGPKRLIAPALEFDELPKVDIVLLSHAHFDHFDLRTLRRFDKDTRVITAPRTRDLLRWTRLHDITELRWNEQKSIETSAGEIKIAAFPVKHWGARRQRDTYRGYNGYLLERNNRRILFAGDTALTNSFADLRKHGGIDLAIMSIGVTIRGSDRTLRPSRRLIWQTPPAHNSLCRCIIKRSGLASNRFGSRSNVSKPPCALNPSASRCARSARHSFCRCRGACVKRVTMSSLPLAPT